MIQRNHLRVLVVALLPFSSGCDAPPEPPAAKPYRPADPWPHQQELLYQTQEVINYLDEQRELELQRLDELGVLPQPAAGEQGQPQADQHEPDGAPIAPAHKEG